MKLSEWSNQFFSDLVWVAVAMTENGVPYSRRALRQVVEDCEETASACQSEAASLYPSESAQRTRKGLPETFEIEGCPLSGPGSATLTKAIIGRVLDDVPDIARHSIAELTPKRKEFSAAKLNRNLIQQILPEDHHYRRYFDLLDTHKESLDLLTDHIYPLQRTYGVRHPRNRDALLVYPSWFLTPAPFKDGRGEEGGTEQGRITASKPPEQTKPYAVKKCRSSRHPGGVLIEKDLPAIEMRVGAMISGDPYLVDQFQNSEDPDLHAALAVFAEGESIRNDPNFHSGDNTKDPRQWYKQGNFVSLYNLGRDESFVRIVANKIQWVLLKKSKVLLPIQKCTRIAEAVRERYAGLWDWQQDEIARAAAKGYVEIPFTGHSRHADASDMHGQRIICNFPFQATAANCMIRLQSRLLRTLPPRARMCLNTYDSVLIDAPYTEAGAVEECWLEANEWLTTQDYWMMLQDHYGREIPLPPN